MSQSDGGETEIVEPRLPETSIFDLEDYLAMQRAISDETRFRVLRLLRHSGELSATELADTLELQGNKLHYHLDELVETGLVRKRKESTADSDGLYTSYTASSIGEAILEHGISELMERESEFLSDYA